MTTPESPSPLRPLDRWLLHLLVPTHLRASFEGDLIEQASAESTPRAARRSLRRQLLRSAPALLLHPGHRTQAQSKLALQFNLWMIPASVAALLWSGIAAAPMASGLLFLVGLSVLVWGTFYRNGVLRLFFLFAGVFAYLIAQGLGGAAVSESIHMIYLIPGTVYPNLYVRNCGRGMPTERRAS